MLDKLEKCENQKFKRDNIFFQPVLMTLYVIIKFSLDINYLFVYSITKYNNKKHKKNFICNCLKNSTKKKTKSDEIIVRMIKEYKH